MNAVDTNVLIYARDNRDPRKKEIATQLIANLGDGCLVWQVACEYLAIAKKLEPFGISESTAFEDIQRMRRLWKPFLPVWSVIERVQTSRERYSLSFWDGLLIATCLEAGVERLYTEDFDSYSAVETLEIVNPFRLPKTA